jgi:hypothetical protein
VRALSIELYATTVATASRPGAAASATCAATGEKERRPPGDEGATATTSGTAPTTTLVSAELGLLAGKAYTCLSLFTDPAAPPRSGRLRALAAVLQLQAAGVTLADVGTSAQYYTELGFGR